VSSVEIYTSKEKQFKIILTQNILERVSRFFTITFFSVFWYWEQTFNCEVRIRNWTYRFSVFQNMLDDVISVLVLKQRLDAGVKLVQDEGGLLQTAVLQDTLNHATAVGMGGQRENLKLTFLQI
jgi:hypothetical protein